MHRCTAPGCLTLIASGSRCEHHQAQHNARRAKMRERYDTARGTASDRGYDRDWGRVRSEWLATHPRCHDCGAEAVMVHHVRPVRSGGQVLDRGNLVSLCGRCHQLRHDALRRR